MTNPPPPRRRRRRCTTTSTTRIKRFNISMDRRHHHHHQAAFRQQQQQQQHPQLITYRYTRRQLAHYNAVDIYNAVASSSTSPHLEYWTNGKTTHLMLVQDPPLETTAKTSSSHGASSFSSSSSMPPQHLAVSSSSSPSQRQASQPSRATTSNNTGSTAASSGSSATTSSSTQQVLRHSLMAGSVSGMASTVILYPLDVLRTKLQAQAAATGPLAVLRQTLQFGGMGALYTGVTLPLLAQALYKGTIFSVHAVTVEWVRDFKVMELQKLGQWSFAQHDADHHHHKLPLDYTDTAICGFVAGAVNAGAFVTPVELVRNQLIAQDSKLAAGQIVSRFATSSWDVIRWTIQSHGVSRLWRGAGITMLRDGIGVAAFFAAKRAVEETLGTADPHRHPPTFATSVLAGGLAGLAFWVVSLPLDTVKTWIQSGDLDRPPVHVTQELRRVWQQGQRNPWGVAQRLLRGWQVAYGRGIPSAAITISVYSSVYHALERRAAT